MSEAIGIVERLNDLRLAAFRAGGFDTPAAKAYYRALSTAFQRDELVDAAETSRLTARIAELEKARGWQPIDETTPKDVSVIVAVMNTYSQTWTVGEAYWNDTDNDWWWANVSSGDYTGDSIFNMNGPVEFWQPMPVAPVARTTLEAPKQGTK